MVSDECVTLRSRDGNLFEVRRSIIEASELVKSLLEETGTEQEIPLPNVESKPLGKVIEFCTWWASNNNATEEERKTYVDGFTLNMEHSLLFELILAANYMDIKPLLEGICKVVGSLMLNKTPEEIKKLFNIRQEFTPEEENYIRRETHWTTE